MSASNEPSQGEACRICLNATFESDASKLDRSALEPSDVDVSDAALSQLLSPCRCTGSVGVLHKGCLLLEVQYRQSSTCQLCRTKYRYVQVRKTQNNSLFIYLKGNPLRSLATILYFLAIPMLTTLWFCNRLKFCTDREQEWSNASYRVLMTKYGDAGTKTSSDWTENRQANNQDEKKLQRQVIHPLVVMVFTYHADVVWINVINLLMIQLIMQNLEHYQQWCVENRPRVAIHLTAA